MDNNKLQHEDFLRLFLKNEREILRYVMAIVPRVADAQEVLQETAIALWNQIDQYDAQRPFKPWAFRFAAIKAKEHLRKQKRWGGFLNEEIASEILSRREELAPQLDLRVGMLRECLQGLSKKNQSVIQKYYFEQATVEDTAHEFGRSVDAVYKSLQRIRNALLDCINRKAATAEGAS